MDYVTRRELVSILRDISDQLSSQPGRCDSMMWVNDKPISCDRETDHEVGREPINWHWNREAGLQWNTP